MSEINKAMAQLDTVTQKNTATSEEAASAAEELAAQSESLKSSVDDLLTVIHGSTSNGYETPKKHLLLKPKEAILFSFKQRTLAIQT